MLNQTVPTVMCPDLKGPRNKYQVIANSGLQHQAVYAVFFSKLQVSDPCWSVNTSVHRKQYLTCELDVICFGLYETNIFFLIISNILITKHS